MTVAVFRPLRLAFVLFTWAVTCPLSAAPTAEERAIALKYYELAVKAQEQEEWSQCEGFIEQALAAAETPHLRFHLAYCLEMQQRWVEALLNYKRVEQAVQGSQDAADLEAYLAPALSSLQERLPTLKVVLDGGAVQGVSLFIDGKQRSATLFGERIPLDPGARSVEVVAAGYRPHRLNVTLVPHEHRVIHVSLSPEATPSSQRPAEARSQVGAAKAAVLALEGAVFVSGVVLGAVFTYEQTRAQRAVRDYERQLGAPPCRAQMETAECSLWGELNDSVTGLKTAKYVSFVGASVSAAALLTTWWLWPNRQSEMATLDVVPTADGVSALLQGRF